MGPYTMTAVDMLDFYERHAEWSQETFGKDSERGPLGPLKHLAKEAQEAIEEAEKAAQSLPGWSRDKLREEIADCLFLVFDASRRSGMSYAELTRVCMAKLDKNKTRSWPKPTSDEPVEHVRS